MRGFFAVLALVLLSGCGDKLHVPFAGSQPDKVLLHEEGPLDSGQNLLSPIKLGFGYRIAVNRLVSYGNSSFQFSSPSVRSPELLIEGPFRDAAEADATTLDWSKFTRQEAKEEGNSLRWQLHLSQPGVYRVLVIAKTWGRYRKDVPVLDPVSVEFACTENCSRPVLNWEEVVEKAAIESVGGKDALYESLGRVLKDLDPTGIWAAKVKEKLQSSPEVASDIFPLAPPLSQLAQFRPALLHMQSKSSKDAVIRGKLAELMGGCFYDRGQLPPSISPELPGFRYGHYPSDTLSGCLINASRSSADILTSLAIYDSGAVTDSEIRVMEEGKEKALHSPSELFTHLLKSGHQIEMRFERTYANFLSLMIDGKSESRVPVWFETGVNLPSGKPLRLPMGHSHVSWRIRGPLVNARVMFFLGMDGAGFHPQIDVRPEWTGLRSVKVVRSGAQSANAEILGVVSRATKYLKRHRLEREGLPQHGYGIIGVCNDSTAVLESGPIAPFPLVRASLLDGTRREDGLDDLMKGLPHDSEVNVAALTPEAREAYTKSVYCRALRMSPHAPRSKVIWNEELSETLKELAEAVPHCF